MQFSGGSSSAAGGAIGSLIHPWMEPNTITSSAPVIANLIFALGSMVDLHKRVTCVVKVDCRMLLHIGHNYQCPAGARRRYFVPLLGLLQMRQDRAADTVLKQSEHRMVVTRPSTAEGCRRTDSFSDAT
jgi:hypothetical protein